MNMRKITSMTMLVSILLLCVNSVVLYIVPEGRVAYWADWHLIGLTKSQWGDQHITVGVLFLVASILHVFYNWSPIVAYMKNKAKEIKVFTGSFNVALLLTILVAVGTYYEVPPMSTILDIGAAIKDGGAEKYGEPPYGHAELSSLKFFAKKEDLDLEKAIALLKEAGLKVEGEKETLKSVAINNSLTPQEVYEVIKSAKIVKEAVVKPEVQGAADTVQASRVAMPDHPRPGFGRRTLDDVCEEYGLDSGNIIEGMKKLGVECTGDMTIKDISKESGKEPLEIFEAIHVIVNEQ